MKPALTKDFLDFITDKKRNSRRVYHLLCGLGYRSEAEKLLNCCSDIGLAEDGKFYKTYFCGNKFCSICNYKKSRKMYSHLYNVVKRLQGSFGFCFITLTARNCSSVELPSMITRLNNASTRFISGQYRTSVLPLSIIKGAFKSLEITYNEESRTYHPHIHVLLALPKVYFNKKKNKDLWLSADEWYQRWEKSIGSEFVSRGGFDVRSVKPQKRKDTIDYAGAIAEVSKYTLKDIPIFKLVDRDYQHGFEVFQTLHDALFHRHTYYFYGIVKKVSEDISQQEQDFHFIQLEKESSFYVAWFSYDGFFYNYSHSQRFSCDSLINGIPFYDLYFFNVLRSKKIIS